MLPGERDDLMSAGNAGAWAAAVLGPGQILIGTELGGDLVC